MMQRTYKRRIKDIESTHIKKIFMALTTYTTWKRLQQETYWHLKLRAAMHRSTEIVTSFASTITPVIRNGKTNFKLSCRIRMSQKRDELRLLSVYLSHPHRPIQTVSILTGQWNIKRLLVTKWFSFSNYFCFPQETAFVSYNNIFSPLYLDINGSTIIQCFTSSL